MSFMFLHEVITVLLLSDKIIRSQRSLNALFAYRSGGDNHMEIMINHSKPSAHFVIGRFVGQDVYGVNVNHETNQCNKENNFLTS